MTGQRLYDTVSDKDGDRRPVHKEGDKAYYEYDNGVELVTEKVREGGGKIKEVRAITRTKTPRKYFYAK